MDKHFPNVLKGELFKDLRGKLMSCNEFDMSQIKRIYSIENVDINYTRGWKGHLIEKRWFLCTRGAIKVSVISIESLQKKINNALHYELTDSNLDVLEVPAGYATLIQQKLSKSRIICFSDYHLNTSNDEELRWPYNHFEI